MEAEPMEVLESLDLAVVLQLTSILGTIIPLRF
jgi:hypothetical protein